MNNASNASKHVYAMHKCFTNWYEWILLRFAPSPVRHTYFYMEWTESMGTKEKRRIAWIVANEIDDGQYLCAFTASSILSPLIATFMGMKWETVQIKFDIFAISSTFSGKLSKQSVQMLHNCQATSKNKQTNGIAKWNGSRKLGWGSYNIIIMNICCNGCFCYCLPVFVELDWNTRSLFPGCAPCVGKWLCEKSIGLNFMARPKRVCEYIYKGSISVFKHTTHMRYDENCIKLLSLRLADVTFLHGENKKIFHFQTKWMGCDCQQQPHIFT